MSYEEEKYNPTCICGHNHDNHAPLVSVNYSAGKCIQAGCDCEYFIIDTPRIEIPRIKIYDN